MRMMVMIRDRIIWGVAGLVLTLSAAALSAQAQEAGAPRNVIFILADDHRYDALGFMDPMLHTPNLDRLAQEGAHYRNAFVTTSLCSPSRASILTGQYMHNHGVVDNNRPIAAGTVFFPAYLQSAGFETAFVGKWHMGGEGDDPQPGFDHWVSFEGQGVYYPSDDPEQPTLLNVNGEHVPQAGYITDELTDYALTWLQEGRDADKPFFLYLSHKAVHADFLPAERHDEQYADAEIVAPDSMAETDENYAGKPMWVKNQRNSWHGVDYPYHSTLDLSEYYRSYIESLSAVDDSVGRLLDYLQAEGLLESTAVIYMGDNGFLFGEHGLIDKRNAYEPSMRVPLLAYAPGLISGGAEVDAIVANIDIAPTVLDLGGVGESPEQFEGASFVGLATGETAPDAWRDDLVYEYYWEYNFPHTPTTFAIRTDRYKLITYHGVWDREELYDLQADPDEMTNLITDPELQDVVTELRGRLYERLRDDGGRLAVPFNPREGRGAVLRERSRSVAAEFPEEWLRDGDGEPFWVQ